MHVVGSGSEYFLAYPKCIIIIVLFKHQHRTLVYFYREDSASLKANQRSLLFVTIEWMIPNTLYRSTWVIFFWPISISVVFRVISFAKNILTADMVLLCLISWSSLSTWCMIMMALSNIVDKWSSMCLVWPLCALEHDEPGLYPLISHVSSCTHVQGLAIMKWKEYHQWWFL